MKRLNQRLTIGLALGMMSLTYVAPVGAQPTDDDPPAPKPTTSAKTAAKAAKKKVAAKGAAGRTTARTKRKTAKAGAAKSTKAAGKANVPAIFYDEEWSYRTATLYEKEKNIVSSVSGEAKFDRDGKYRQDYYIGSIGNFFKGTYKIQGDRLITYDEKGKQIFDFKFTVGTNPPILVLTLLNKDGSKSMDFSLVPLEKKH
ncbi:MAG: hypothetical protein M3347_02790 [Armatimonadota bacterium]|nr:hypothetical protein [Armatimonadota bacterium]